MEVFPAPEGAVMIMILLLEAMRKDGEKKNSDRFLPIIGEYG